MPQHKVFISHAHADNALCDPLVRALQARGLDVWYDRTDLQDGRLLSAEIERELLARTALVVCCTDASVKSYWVRKEVDAFEDLLAKEPS